MRHPRARPGVRFDAGAITLPDTLPRMDVAAFVGFASRGPLDSPVAIEDENQFGVVFGPPPRLNWDEARQAWNEGLLRPAVRSFFANGGQRAWVSRVAGPTAQARTFMLPGCVRVPMGGQGVVVAPASLRAASVGSWADALRLSARVVARPVGVDLSPPADGPDDAISVASITPPQVGDVLRLALDPLGRQGWYPVSELLRTGSGGRSIVRLGPGLRTRELAVPAGVFSGAPGRGAVDVRLAPFGSAVAQVVIKGRAWDVEASAAPVACAPWAEIVSLELRVDDLTEGTFVIQTLGLASRHPHFVGALQSSEDWYRDAANTHADGSPMPQAFPLAGMARADVAELWLPLGLGERFELSTTANESTASRLQRDGLAVFEPAPFLDPDLADAASTDLMARADFIRYQAEPTRRLRGIHAMLGSPDTAVGEQAVLIAVPDAAHRPWDDSDPRAPDYLWGSWPADTEPDDRSFLDCPGRLLAPALNGLVDANHLSATLSWSAPPGAVAAGLAGQLHYVLQESATRGFAVVDVPEPSTETTYRLDGLDGRERNFRVRAEAPGVIGAWSDTLTLRQLAGADQAAETSALNPVLLAVHRALLGMCAARMDLFAVLALPRTCSEAEALQHAQNLAGSAASFGAIYHPWFEVAVPAGAPQPQPPDGAATGFIAARSIERGAWVAPANLSVRGALALHPRPLANLDAFIDTGINALEPGPRSVVVLCADTLAEDASLRPLQVRRLLMLLRRLALRLGNEFVFEPNDPGLHAYVRRRFEQALGDLFRRGAFSGRAAADAFQVSVDPAVNSATTAQRGELIVDIRVRPAQSLQFIQVRLVLTGSGNAVLEAA